MFGVSYEEIVSMENLLDAWNEFLIGKKKKTDVQAFKERLLENVRALHEDLVAHRYQHEAYYHFRIADSKPRDIHKASVRDRLLHHAIYRKLYPLFDKVFIADSFSCRVDKGTHKAMDRFQRFARSVSRNSTRTCWVLKLDIRKFFASIDHDVLLLILYSRVSDLETMWLFERVISSFSSGVSGKGLPLGNLTSQLFANVYMNEFDQCIKHELKVRYYIRYADDFVFLSHDRDTLLRQLPRIEKFLWEVLRLRLHPKKIELRTVSSGVDFLGWKHYERHRTLRTITRQRMFRKLVEKSTDAIAASYAGLLRHGNAYSLQVQLANEYWLFSEK
jgi:RNA-directed DNA polymerase